MSTGFMAASGSTPAAAACSAWARPISAPPGVTAELLRHVLGLERRDAHAGAGQPSADAGRHDALAGVGRRPAYEQRAPHRADTLPVAIGLPPALVEPAHLDPAAARRHRAPAPPAARVEEEPAARGARAAVHAREPGRVAQQRDRVDGDREANRARIVRRPPQVPAAVRGRCQPRGARRLGVLARERLEVGPPRAASFASAEKRRCSTSRNASAASSSASSTTGVRPRTIPIRRPQRASVARLAQRLGGRRDRLVGGRPVDAVGEVQAQRAAPELDRLRGDTRHGCLTI